MLFFVRRRGDLEYKNIEKYIDPSKLDMELIPDIEDDSSGKFLFVNSDGELEWKGQVEFDPGEINIELGKLKDGLKLTIDKVTSIEGDIEGHREEFTKIKITLSEMSSSIGQIEKSLDNKLEDSDLDGIRQFIEWSTSAIEQYRKQITLLIEEAKITGSYTIGSNKIPTVEWQNQVNPLHNAYLNNFIFEQDNGWIGSSKEAYSLMFSGGEYLSLSSPIAYDGSYTIFSFDLWIRPIENTPCKIFDFFWLFDQNGNLRFTTQGVDVRTRATAIVGEINHIAISCNMQSKEFHIWLNGEAVELFQTITADGIVFPKSLTLFEGLSGLVYSFRFYRILMDDDICKRNYKERHIGQRYSLYGCNCCFEAHKAEAVNVSFDKVNSELTLLSNEIRAKVSQTIYDEDKKQTNEKLESHSKSLFEQSGEIKVLKDQILLKVETDTFNSFVTTNSSNLKNIISRIESTESGIETLVGNLKLYVKTETYETSLKETQDSLKQLRDMINGVADDIHHKVEILSTKGTCSKNGQIDTSLYPVLYKGNDNISNTLIDNQVEWHRITEDEEADNVWDLSHDRKIILDITGADLGQKLTVFIVMIYDKDNPTKVIAKGGF